MYCPKCGTRNEDNAYRCLACNEVIQVMPVSTPSIEDDPAMRILLPVGRSGLAIAAGYLGLFAVLLVPAPFAVLFSILAIQDIKRNPKKLGMGRAIFGLIMGILGTIGLIALLIDCIVNLL